MEKCYDEFLAITLCKEMYSTIMINCKSHPDQLLGCNDSRLIEYSLIIKTIEERINQSEIFINFFVMRIL